MFYQSVKYTWKGFQKRKEEAGPQRKAWLTMVRFTDHSEARSVKKRVCGRRVFVPTVLQWP